MSLEKQSFQAQQRRLYPQRGEPVAYADLIENIGGIWFPHGVGPLRSFIKGRDFVGVLISGD